MRPEASVGDGVEPRSPRGTWRRRMGIEPTWDLVGPTTALKAASTTRHWTPPPPTVSGEDTRSASEAQEPSGPRGIGREE
jgi:hypothetical protein